MHDDMRELDLVIIGGGCAGLASALAAYKHGIRDILIIEREPELGGILQQCIHTGFGLHRFEEEMSGPTYAEREIHEVEGLGIEYKLNTMVIHLDKDKRIVYANEAEGYVTVQAKAIILAMGCRERTRGGIALPGSRPSGIWTAGTAQKYINQQGYMVGRRIFVVGSGDIGLIMARRMTLEGAKVVGVAEIMPYSAGLPRNLKQCLEDYEIPLYVRHCITNIQGKERLTSIEISEVNQQLEVIEGTQKRFEVDTLLLSVGLIPENTLSEEAAIGLHPKTQGPIINESYETSIPGVFACGNVLHVHDVVDLVSEEGENAGIHASQYLKNLLSDGAEIDTIAKKGISYIIPQRVRVENIQDVLELKYRVTQPYEEVNLVIRRDEKVIRVIKKSRLIPSQMEQVVVTRNELTDVRESISLEIQRG